MSLLDGEDILLDETSYESIMVDRAKDGFSKFVVSYPYKLQHLYVHVGKSDYPEKWNTTNACNIISEVLGDYPCKVYECASTSTYNDFLQFLNQFPSGIIVFREFSAIQDTERKKFGEFIKEHSDRRTLEGYSISHRADYHFIFVDGPVHHRQVYSVFYPVLYGEFYKVQN